MFSVSNNQYLIINSKTNKIPFNLLHLSPQRVRLHHLRWPRQRRQSISTWHTRVGRQKGKCWFSPLRMTSPMTLNQSHTHVNHKSLNRRLRKFFRIEIRTPALNLAQSSRVKSKLHLLFSVDFGRQRCLSFPRAFGGERCQKCHFPARCVKIIMKFYLL